MLFVAFAIGPLHARHEPELPCPAGDEPGQHRDDRGPVDVAVPCVLRIVVEAGDVDLAAAHDVEVDEHHAAPRGDPHDDRRDPVVEVVREVLRLDERDQRDRPDDRDEDGDLPACRLDVERERSERRRVEVQDVRRDRPVHHEEQDQDRRPAERRGDERGRVGARAALAIEAPRNPSQTVGMKMPRYVDQKTFFSGVPGLMKRV